MIAKVIGFGLGGLLLAGVIYLGTVGITVSSYAAKVEIPLKNFQR